MGNDSPPKSPLARGAVLLSATPEEVFKNDHSNDSERDKDDWEDPFLGEMKREIAKVDDCMQAHMGILDTPNQDLRKQFELLPAQERRSKMRNKILRFAMSPNERNSSNIKRTRSYKLANKMMDLLSENDLLNVYWNDDLFETKVIQFRQEEQKSRMKAQFDLLSPAKKTDEMHKKFLGAVFAHGVDKHHAYKIVDQMMELIPESEFVDVYCDHALLEAKAGQFFRNYEDNNPIYKKLKSSCVKEKFDLLSPEEQNSKMRNKFLVVVIKQGKLSENKDHAYKVMDQMLDLLPESEQLDLYFRDIDDELLVAKANQFIQNYEDNKPLHGEMKVSRFKAEFDLMTPEERTSKMHKKFLAIVIETGRLFEKKQYGHKIVDQMMDLLPESELVDMYWDRELLVAKANQFIQEYEDNKPLHRKIQMSRSRKKFDLLTPERQIHKIKKAFYGVVQGTMESLAVDVENSLKMFMNYIMSFTESELHEMYVDEGFELLKAKVVDMAKQAQDQSVPFQKVLRRANFQRMTCEQQEDKLHKKFFAVVAEKCEDVQLSKDFFLMLTDYLMSFPQADLEEMYFDKTLLIEKVDEVVRRCHDAEDTLKTDLRASFEQLSDEKRDRKMYKMFRHWITQAADVLNISHLTEQMIFNMMSLPESERLDLYFDRESLKTRVTELVETQYQQWVDSKSLRDDLFLLVAQEVMPMGLQAFASRITNMLLTLPESVVETMLRPEPALVKHWVGEAVTVLENGDSTTIEGKPKDISRYVMVQVLDDRFDTHSLFKMFKQFGKIISGNICRDEEKDCRINGYGYVEFKKSASASAAIHGTKDHGKLVVNHFNTNNCTAGTPEGDLAARYPEIGALIHPNHSASR